MFQPSMMGNLEAGLAETMEYVLKHFSAEDQLLLANNVFLTGGGSQLPGNRGPLYGVAPEDPY